MKNKGFTLMEMLVAIAVGGVVLSLASVLLIDSLRTWQREENEFSSWQSGERFLRELRRDMRRAVPGGAGYDGEVLEIEFLGEFAGLEDESPPFISFTARYYMHPEEGRGAVRELFTEDGMVSSRVYPGVEYFSAERSGEYPSVFELTVGIERAAAALQESIHAPAEAERMK